MEFLLTIGVIYPDWNFWEGVVTVSTHDYHRGLRTAAVAVIEEHGNVRWDKCADDLEAGLPVVDLIVVVATLAAPPASVGQFLRQRPSIPVVVWAYHESPRVQDPFTHESITLRGATVGASMVTASVSNAGSTPDVVVGDTQSVAVRTALRAGAAAALIRRARISVIGEPLEGYDFMDPPEGELARLGVELVRHRPEDFAQQAADIPKAALHHLYVELADHGVGIMTDVSIQTTSRYAVALERLMDGDRSHAGTLNCHVPSLRLNPKTGAVAPCFALGRETSRGRPWTCTGDVNTSLAMLLVSSLGRPTMYHEMEAIDECTNEIIFANSGEHDRRFPSTSPPTIRPNPWFPDGAPTPIVALQVAPGPASVVAVTASDGRIRVVVAEGRFTARDTAQTGTMSAAFQFEHVTAGPGWREWVRTGVGHHSCATTGHVRTEIQLLCEHLGLDLVVVGREAHTTYSVSAAPRP